MKVKLNDKVLVISGKDKSKTGRVIRVITKHRQITVEKINMRTKHIKKTKAAPGEKITFEAPIDVSNAVIICPSCNKPTRASYNVIKDGKKERVCKKCGETLDKQLNETAIKPDKKVIKV